MDSLQGSLATHSWIKTRWLFISAIYPSSILRPIWSFSTDRLHCADASVCISSALHAAKLHTSGHIYSSHLFASFRFLSCSLRSYVSHLLRQNNGEKQADIAILKSLSSPPTTLCLHVSTVCRDRQAPVCHRCSPPSCEDRGFSHRYYLLLVSAHFSSAASHL